MGQQKNRGIIGILTGGGDVPGLNPAIRAVTIRALREGYKVIGIKRGWGGLIDIVRDPQYDNSGNFFELTEEIVNKAGRTGGTFLHTSRTRASHVPKANVPKHLQDKYLDDINDLTPEVLKNLEFMGIDYLIPIGGGRHVELCGTLEQGKRESRGHTQNHGQRRPRNRLLYWVQHLYHPYDCPHA